MKTLLAIALLTSATGALAADFKGPWIEARGGYDSVQLSASLDGDSDSESKGGFAYGAAAGYDFSVGAKAVAGVQIGATGTTVKVCSEVYGLDEACLKADRDLEVLARVGFKAADDTLIYGLAGYANGKVSASYVDFEGILDSFEFDGTQDGLRVGAGVEQAFTGGAYAKLEYRYTSYSKTDLSDFLDEDVQIGFNRHQVLAAFGYRF